MMNTIAFVVFSVVFSLVKAADIPPAVFPKSCEDPTCTSGRCIFKDCQFMEDGSEDICIGGLCSFENCDFPRCKGGLCTFTKCASPICEGGACTFVDTATTVGHGYCDGGKCTVDGEEVISDMKSDLIY